MTSLHRTIAAAFESSPDNAAVGLARGKSIDYATLEGQIGALQAVIDEAEPRAVGILSTRSAAATCAVLAAFFCGVRFVPMNPELPVERLQKVVRLGTVDLVLHDGKRKDVDQIAPGIARDISEIIAMQAPASFDREVPSDALAYQMFTSGSTGEPKGVPITYGNLDHYVTHIRAATGLGATPGRFSNTFDLSFDLAMHDIFVCFASGGTLVPASDIDLMMPPSYIEKKAIDYWFSVPLIASIAIRALADRPVGHKLRMAMFCGEQLPSDYAASFEVFVEDGAPIFNLYGPTEATIAFTAKRFDRKDMDHAVVPLGDPFGDNLIAVETSEGQIEAITEGVEGELLLGGPQVFDGYNPANPSEVFVGDTPRYYRSGDIVAMRGGELHHLGRKDGQIKLRGYRIELGDIEAAFRRSMDCSAAAAVLLGEGEGRQIAVAYEADRPLTQLERLKESLPDYMMPAQVKRLDKLPTNINGKIDRKALKAMAWDN